MPPSASGSLAPKSANSSRLMNLSRSVSISSIIFFTFSDPRAFMHDIDKLRDRDLIVAVGFELGKKMSLRKGSKVWAEDRDLAWVAAEVVDFVGDQVQVATSSGNKVVTLPVKLFSRDEDVDHGGVDDMTKLTYLNEPGVLENLERRYTLNEIYTYTGSILIAVNPFTRLPHLYNGHMMEQYKGAPFGELSPHVFAVADASYRAMMKEARSQSILVSGESGAGKTETTKLIMQYLTFVGGRAAGDDRTVEQQVLETRRRKERSDEGPVRLGKVAEVRRRSGEEQARLSEVRNTSSSANQWYRYVVALLQREKLEKPDADLVEQPLKEFSNPLLEAFGNARTVRNDNSSRFGKFVEIQFDAIGKISGAAIRTYLLERSRVVQITDGERNYHCFYQLCASGGDAEKYKLGHPSHFHYINQSKTYELDGVNSAEEYMKTIRAMDIVGISHGEQEAIFRILAGILHLGNIDFSPGQEHDSSVIKDQKSSFHMEMAANLFIGVVAGMVTGGMVVVGEFGSVLGLRLVRVSWVLAAVRQVHRCDVNLLLATLCTRSIQTREGIIIKALDCNAAVASRDALAKTVYARVFDWLVNKINSSVGQDKDSFIQIGVLDIYGFECFKINSFEQFCINFANEKLQQHFNEHVFKMEQEEYRKEEINWSYVEFIDNQDVLDLIEKKPIGIIALLDEACMFPKSTHGSFTTKLFQNFRAHPRLDKAKFSETDFTMSHYAGKACHMSQCPFIAGLFPSLPDESSRSSYKFSSVASRFKGVLEAVRISLAGYPTRKTYHEFVDRFGLIALDVIDGSYNEKTATEKILKKLKLENYQLGKTKVFLRAGQIGVLDSQRAEVLDNAAKCIQERLRTFVARRDFLSTRVAAVSLQACCRDLGLGGTLKVLKMFVCFQAVLLKKGELDFDVRKFHDEANETGALRLAKTKLEKQLEDLTWRLQLEKKLRLSNEEAKSIEISKLQKTVESLRLGLDAAKMATVNECNKNAVLQKQLELSMKEKSAMEGEMVVVAELRNENASLKNFVNALEKKNSILEQEFVKAKEYTNDTMKKLWEVEKTCLQLQQKLQSFEEKLCSLEDENHVLRQKTLFASPKSNRPGVVKPFLEKYTGVLAIPCADRKSVYETPTPTKLITPLSQGLSDSRRTKLTTEKHQENDEFLSSCIKEDLGFKDGKPVAACVVYKCLVQWHAFDSERTSIFDYIIEGINEVLKVGDENVTLPYWLSNTSALLCFLQKNSRSNGLLTASSQRSADELDGLHMAFVGLLDMVSLADCISVSGLASQFISRVAMMRCSRPLAGNEDVADDLESGGSLVAVSSLGKEGSGEMDGAKALPFENTSASSATRTSWAL
ncbi:hypothetical protein C3L33_21913, partial [Rhododendron williamsianum]